MSVKLHFLNVGGGDCTIIHFPARVCLSGERSIDERVMLVDVNHHADHKHYENVLTYYKTNFRDTSGRVLPIFRFVCSHPHQDHICGMDEFLNDPDIQVFNFWDLDHEFEPEDFDFHPTHADDWSTYRGMKQKEHPRYLQLSRESAPMLYWNDDEDRIKILSPSAELRKHAHFKEDGTKRASHEIEIDDMSYALLIRINSRKVLLAGDGRTSPFWEDIYNNCATDIQNVALLKAGHHGQESAFHEEAVKLMQPSHIVFSNSFEDDTASGAEKLYAKAVPGSNILKTWIHGTIVVNVPFDAAEPLTYSSALYRAVEKRLLAG